MLRPVMMACMLLGAEPLAAQFEGVLETANVTTNDTGAVQEFTMTMWIKPDRIKVSSGSTGAAGGFTMIYRSDRRIIWMLNEDDRTYAEIEQQQDSVGDAPAASGGGFRIRRTGRNMKILGFPCEQILITRADEKTELWGSTRFKRLQETLARVLGTDRAGTPADWSAEVERMGLFPLRAATKISGHLVESQEVTRIQEMTLAPEIFELPAGYRKNDLDRMINDGGPE
jgi:hypothetical protein